MPCYPDISSPCPVADRLDEVMDGSFCRQCRETVTDLDALDAAARYRLMARTGGGLCVRYRSPGPAALAAAAMLAAGLGALPAAAQEVLVSAEPQPAAYDEIIVGGARILTRAERLQLKREARREEQRVRREMRRTEKAARSPAS